MVIDGGVFEGWIVDKGFYKDLSSAADSIER